MSAINPHPIYSRDAAVYLESGDHKFETLDRALTASQFFDHLTQKFTQSGKVQQDFLIAIKPNIMTGSICENPSPVYTDPELVEYLINRIREQGYGEIAVVESHNVYDYSYQGRTVPAVAEMAGYSGSGYRLVDLTGEKEPHDFGGVLQQHYVGRTWRDADYRISFAKNKTHWQCFYTGCLKNIYGCLPEWDKMKHYHGKDREFYECCILMADNFPVHFGLLDAWVSGDGFSGHVRDANPNPTRTIMASENIFALDWVMGEKMGIDPTLNYVIQEAMKKWGTLHITRRGDLTPWSPWKNVRRFTVKVLDVMEEWYGISRFFSRSFASRQDPRFPPVSRWQWLYGMFQRVMRIFEGQFVTQSKPQ